MGNVIIILLDEIQFHELKTYVTASFDWRIIWDKKSTPKKREWPHMWLFNQFSPNRVKIEKTLRKTDTLRNNEKDFEMSYHDM